MLREWFREDENFAILNDEEKKNYYMQLISLE